MLSAKNESQVVETTLVALGALDAIHISRFRVIPNISEGNGGSWRTFPTQKGPVWITRWNLTFVLGGNNCSPPRNQNNIGKSRCLPNNACESRQLAPFRNDVKRGALCGHSLPFGLRSAPKVFIALADGLEWILCDCRGCDLIHYLDDY